jgi:transcription antitermination factor NusG
MDTEPMAIAAVNIPSQVVQSSLVSKWSEPLWYAAYTSPNHEKRVAAELQQRDVEHFLPLYTSVRRWKDRRVRLELPLFPSYIFARLALKHRLTVLQIPSVVHFVGFSGKPHPIPTVEIEQLRRGIEGSARIEPHPYLAIGRRVRIRRGPLMGAEGILVRKKNFYRVVLSIGLINSCASVEVDVSDVEPESATRSQETQA